MEKKKALLIVTGGRAIPDVLTLLWLRPQLVIILLSEEPWGTRLEKTPEVGQREEAFVSLAKSIPDCQVKVIRDIDVYNLEMCMRVCREVSTLYPSPEWDWIFHITSSPKVIGIAAYEAAKEYDIPCWHVDVQRDRHVSLVQAVTVDKEKFFHLTLADYIGAQGRTLVDVDKSYRQHIRRWANVATHLVTSSEMSDLQGLLYKFKKERDYLEKECLLEGFSPSSPLLAHLQSEGVLDIRSNAAREVYARFTSKQAAQFIGTGDWLEFYVGNAIMHSDFADEKYCQWGCEVLDGSVKREFDLLLIYKAQLIVAECKAERDPFDGRKGHLHKLRAKADVLGGAYVSKIFITNQPGTGKSFDSFRESARHYETVVVTAEDLPEIAAIMREQAKKPTYQRI